MRGWRVASIAAAAALGIAALAFAAFAWRPAIGPVAQRTDVPSSDLVRDGERFAALGNCASCHTTAAGLPYAGGVPLTTPFGTIYGSNLTPDPQAGLGAWSEAAFARAMRQGVSRDGHLLYPAFPYTHFQGTTDDELHALYTFLMSQDPSDATPPGNSLFLPLRWRPLMAGWNLLFLHDAHDPVAVAKDPVDARGIHLVETLGHCGACHTPRNLLAAEKRDAALEGAVIDGWYAPPIDARSPSPVVWSVEAMTSYLRTGLTDDHAIAGGPMQQVVAGLEHADAADVTALATAVVDAMGPPGEAGRSREAASRKRAERPLAGTPFDASDARLALGASVYATACAGCHDRGRDVSSNSGLRMPLAVALYEDQPLSLLRVIRGGIVPRDGRPGRWMPAYGETLSDEQLVALLAYLRQVAADAPAWPHLERAVAATAR